MKDLEVTHDEINAALRESEGVLNRVEKIRSIVKLARYVAGMVGEIPALEKRRDGLNMELEHLALNTSEAEADLQILKNKHAELKTAHDALNQKHTDRCKELDVEFTKKRADLDAEYKSKVDLARKSHEQYLKDLEAEEAQAQARVDAIEKKIAAASADVAKIASHKQEVKSL